MQSNLRQTPKQRLNAQPGFTIVELLIVIVVIGILASIVIVAYNGIQQKARVAALQSDMSNAASVLELSNALNNTYPADLLSAELKASDGTSYQYTYNSSSNSYCLTGTNSGVSYFASADEPSPMIGVCNPGVSTLAGSGIQGFADGSAASAQFYNPQGVAVDSSGTVYVADRYNQRIRKVTASGVVSTLAGSGVGGFADGTGTAAKFNYPFGVAVDSSGTVYVADRDGQRIRKITSAGVVTTLAGSGVAGFADDTGTAAQFKYPSGIAVDASGTVYVADSSNHRIRKITASGVVSTLAGSGVAGFADGTGTAAQFSDPFGIAVDASGAIYVADTINNRIRKITSAGAVTTIAGSGVAGFADGTGTAAQFNGPRGVAVDSSGAIYVVDTNNNRIRKITSAGAVTTIAGSGVAGFANGFGTSVQFAYPDSVAVDAFGTIYVADRGNSRIRKLQ